MISDFLPSEKLIPRRFGLGAWSGHVPFAYDLMSVFKPATFVELGCHRGESYSAFCQAVADFNLPSICYGVDTWKGDKHAGFYDDSIYDELTSFNQKNYSTFSYLVRSDFDSASAQFSEESIDLLHIDGLHTYEAVKHDFDVWLPKVKKSGLILFHDIVVRHDDFGVWKLWEELQQRFATFSFHHGYGLGVLALNEAELPRASIIQKLFSKGPEQEHKIRSSYENAYQRLSKVQELILTLEKCRELEEKCRTLESQLDGALLQQQQMQYRLNRRAFRWTAWGLNFLDRHKWLKLGI